MFTLLASLAAVAAPMEVTTGPVVWQIRRVGLAELKENPLAALALGARIRGGMQVTTGDKPDPVKMPTLGELGPALAKSEGAMTGFLCAGVVAVRQIGEEKWTPVTIVSERGRENPEQGKLHFLSLQPEWRKILAEAIADFAAGEGEAANRLASFLGRPVADA